VTTSRVGKCEGWTFRQARCGRQEMAFPARGIKTAVPRVLGADKSGGLAEVLGYVRKNARSPYVPAHVASQAD